MRRAAAMIGAGQRVAVLFGPERSGLENDDIARANAIISVPVNLAFPSLNLEQCVLLVQCRETDPNKRHSLVQRRSAGHLIHLDQIPSVEGGHVPEHSLRRNGQGLGEIFYRLCAVL